jgi:hypothetical protein
MVSRRSVAALALHSRKRVCQGSALEPAFLAETDRMASQAVGILTLAGVLEHREGVGVQRLRPIVMNVGVAQGAPFSAYEPTRQSTVPGRRSVGRRRDNRSRGTTRDTE